MSRSLLSSVLTLAAFILLGWFNVQAQTWTTFGTGTNNEVNVVCVSANGTLYAGGYFDTTNGFLDNYVAQWNGTVWSGLGSGFPANIDTFNLQTYISAMSEYQGNLYVSGQFDSVGGVAAQCIAMWNGSMWSSVGPLIIAGDSSYAQANGTGIWALTVYNGNLIAGGNIVTSVGDSYPWFAQWNGTTWTPMPMNNAGVASVQSFVTYKDTLYATGLFQSNTSSQNYGVAKWTGSSWAFLGPMDANGYVWTSTVYDNSIYFGGTFDSLGGIPTANIVSWNGNTWSPLGSGIGPADSLWTTVYTLASYDNNLYAGGVFTSSGGAADTNFAIWNGTTWLPGCTLDYNGALGAVGNFFVAEGSLYVGGAFTEACGTTAYHVAKLTLPTAIPPAIGIATAVNLFPNPNTGNLTISLQNAPANCTVSIYDATGRCIAATMLNPGANQINLGKNAKGIYCYRVVAEDGSPVDAGKFLVQ